MRMTSPKDSWLFLGRNNKDSESKKSTNDDAPPYQRKNRGKSTKKKESSQPVSINVPVEILRQQYPVSIQTTPSFQNHDVSSEKNQGATADVAAAVSRKVTSEPLKKAGGKTPHKCDNTDADGENQHPASHVHNEQSGRTGQDIGGTQVHLIKPSSGEEPVPTNIETNGRTTDWVPLPQSDNHQPTLHKFKDSDSVSIRRGFNTLWPNSFAKIFRATKNPEPITATVDIKENDIIVAIMGRSGLEEKHEFVCNVIGHGPHHEDGVEVRHVVVEHPRDSDRNMILVYTTGNDEKLSDALRSISTWLTGSSPDRKLSGVIYLEPITSRPAPKLARTPLDVINKYVEKLNVVIVTTGWGDIKPVDSEQRQKEARDRWTALVGRGISLLKLCPPGALRDADSASALDFGLTPRDIINLALLKVDEKRSGTRSEWKGKEKRAGDIFMDDPRSTDIVIPIMGPTGVGKSTFINTVAAKTVTKVGHSLNSETAQLHPVILPHPNEPLRRVILLDTPGFNDTYVSESEILRRIAAWLAESYSAHMKLAGVIYFHEITQTRMLGTSRRDLDMFNKLCGKEAMKNVILATTKWGEVLEKVGVQREKELKETHWRDMMDLGSDVKRFEGTHGSGWEILDRILEDDSNGAHIDAVAIQDELVEIKKILPDTEAGRTLLYSLEEMLEIQRYQGEQLRGDDSNSELKQRIRENNEKVHAMMKQIKELSGPLHHRLLGWMKKMKFSHGRGEENATKDS